MDGALFRRGGPNEDSLVSRIGQQTTQRQAYSFTEDPEDEPEKATEKTDSDSGDNQARGC